jgi:sugar/nucleoside kinase (ribokinase family)
MVIRTARMPAAGKTVTAPGITFGHGGKGSNQAVQAAWLGAAVSLLAAVGDDEAAAAAVLLWTAAGVDMRGVQRLPDVPTGTAVVLVEPSGENRILVVPSANAMLDTANAANSASEGPLSVVLAQLGVPLGAIKAAFSAARQRSAWTMVNAAPVSAKRGVPTPRGAAIWTHTTAARVAGCANTCRRATTASAGALGRAASGDRQWASRPAAAVRRRSGDPRDLVRR